MYRVNSRRQFDPAADYVATSRTTVFNGAPMKEGDPMPLPPKDPSARIRFLRTMRQMFDARRIDFAPVTHKEIPNGSAKI